MVNTSKLSAELSQNLQESTEAILQLVEAEPSLRSQDLAAVECSLRKILSPSFEIAFVGAFSAGKSMLINAILGRELLYSAEGHATGIECYIAHAPEGKERVVLTFLSYQEIEAEARLQLKQLGVPSTVNFSNTETIETVLQP